MPFVFNKTKLAIGCLVILGAGCAVGVWRYQDAHKNLAGDISADAQRCALTFQSRPLTKLSGSLQDENTPDYIATKQLLDKLNDAHTRVQSIYLYRIIPETSRFVCLAGSVPQNAPHSPRPGDPFFGEINETDILKTLHDDVITINENQNDRYGRNVSIYARIDADGNRDILRLDIDINTWRAGLLKNAFRYALYVWLLLGIPFAVYVIARRYSHQSIFIHKLTAAIEQSATPMLIVNDDGVIAYVNESLCVLSKFARPELLEQHWLVASRASPSETIIKIETLSYEGNTWTEDLELERKGGERFPATVTSTPIRNIKKQIIGHILVFSDTTETRRQAREMRMARERAESADHAKSTFLATMSHEVRTPLNGIAGFSDLLLGTELTPEQREYVHAIHTSGDALIKLTGNILDYSRIESGRMRLNPEVCDLAGIIEETLDVVAPRASGKKLQLLHNIDPSLPPTVIADPVRLRQVLINLIGNAIKFTPSGEVEVAVHPVLFGTGKTASSFGDAATSAAPESPSNDAPPRTLKLEFSVRDTGIGIAPEDLSRLFRPFVQLDSSSARRFGGAGLGLVISYDLVQLMGGNISVTSEHGKGTTFTFTIVCAHPQATGPVENAPDELPRLSGKRVAIVSPSTGLRDEIKRELTRQGATVINADMNDLDSNTWDLSVVDCDENTIAHLREYMTVPERWRGYDMVGLVDIAMEMPKRQILQPYFRALLSKPVHHSQLVEKLARHRGDIAASSDSAEL